jgi:stress-induced morphogen
MAIITRGPVDAAVGTLKTVLDEYEQQHAGSAAALYRQNSGAIRIRIVDPRFAGRSKSQRHDDVWDFISHRLTEDARQEISVLLMLSPGEDRTSLMNLEFDDPIQSKV